MKLPIYLDYSATTPVDPRVAQKMITFLTDEFGNPASRSHAYGWAAEAAVEEARANVAALVNCAAGATWVSVHHGGGVGIGFSQHAGMVVVADGTDEAERRLRRVLTSDPAMGVLRHADAGYREALDFAAEHGPRIPHISGPARRDP